MPERNKEHRCFNYEVRQSSDNENSIESYAAVYDEWSQNLGGFREIIRPGTFTKTIIENDIRALINHDPNLIIGRNKSNTLELFDDPKGLKYRVELPDTSYAKDLKSSVKRGDISQNSFGFLTIKDRWGTETFNGVQLAARELFEVKLFDVSPVSFPAYEQAEGIKIRCLENIGVEKLGINIDVLEGIVMRKQVGLELKPADKEMLSETINFLNILLRNEKPTQESHFALNEIEYLEKKLNLISKI